MSEKNEQAHNGGGEKRHLTSAERQKIYMERAAGRRRDNLTRAEKKKRRTATLFIGGVLGIVALIVGISLLWSNVLQPMSRYNDGVKLLERADYLSAMDVFEALGDYKDSRDMVKKCILEQARALSGREDVNIGSSAEMPWFSFDKENEDMLKFDAEKYRGDAVVVIPDVFDGKLVKGIAERAFYRCDFLKGIVIPPSVKAVSSRAFYGCELLSEVLLPDAVEAIGEYAFGKCTELTSVRFGTRLRRVEQRAFDGCEKLLKLSLPEGVEHLGYRAFAGCSSVESIDLPSSLKKIEAQAFAGCEKLKNVAYAGNKAELEALLSEEGGNILRTEPEEAAKIAFTFGK